MKLHKLKYLFLNLLFLFAASVILVSLLQIDEVYAESSYEECSRRCSKLTGQGKHNCIKICLRALKKKNYKHTKKTKKKIEECKTICSAYTGIENVKCLRLCLDKNKDTTSNSEEFKKSDPKQKECEERCKVLTGTLKYKCLKKCKLSMK